MDDHELPSFDDLNRSILETNSGSEAQEGRRTSSHPEHLALLMQIKERDQVIVGLRGKHKDFTKCYEQLSSQMECKERELAAANNDKTSLKSRIDVLTNQVERLKQEKQQLQDHAFAEAAQWKQILILANQLQIQGIAEVRHFNDERESWRREKDNLERSVSTLTSMITRQSDTNTVATSIPALGESTESVRRDRDQQE